MPVYLNGLQVAVEGCWFIGVDVGLICFKTNILVSSSKMKDFTSKQPKENA